MKLGFMIYSLGRALAAEALTVPGAFALMKELGAEGVDITGGHVSGYTTPEVKRMVQDAGLVVSAYIGGAGLATDDSAARTEALDQIKRVIDTGAALETANILVTTGGCTAGQDRADGRRNVAAGLAQVLPYAESCGVTLSIEDFGSPVAPYQTSAECMQCCELAGPGLMMTYDSGNMVLGDEDPVAFLAGVTSRLVHAHAKDWEQLPANADFGLTSQAGRKYVGAVVGEGVLDYPAIIAKLKALDYQGFLSFEYEGRGDPVAAARQGMAYLGRLVSET